LYTPAPETYRIQINVSDDPIQRRGESVGGQRKVVIFGDQLLEIPYKHGPKEGKATERGLGKKPGKPGKGNPRLSTFVTTFQESTERYDATTRENESGKAGELDDGKAEQKKRQGHKIIGYKVIKMTKGNAAEDQHDRITRGGRGGPKRNRVHLFLSSVP